jgi:hypothetical protein
LTAAAAPYVANHPPTKQHPEGTAAPGTGEVQAVVRGSGRRLQYLFRGASFDQALQLDRHAGALELYLPQRRRTQRSAHGA